MTSFVANRSWNVRGHTIPVALPTLRDPRLHLASVIISLHILGQTALNFELSIPQILIAIFTSASIEFLITLRRHRAIVWPASAMLTGNGVAFILRVPGTNHGDWWSFRGWWIFAGTAAISLLSKHTIRRHGTHIFNPSNFGLLLCFLILGSTRAEPLDFWWGSNSLRIYAALTIILVGGLVILSRLKMLQVAVMFWCTFAATMAVLGFAGHCMTARWHVGPLCGRAFTQTLITSPELLVFMFFMITDPRTSPTERRARTLYSIAIAVLAALFIAPQRTEFATKVALLLALAIVCAVRPIIDWATDPTRVRTTRLRTSLMGAGIAVAISATLVTTSFGHADFAKANNQPQSTTRPEIALPLNAIPPFTIDNSNRVSSQIELPVAKFILQDTVTDLFIIERAQREQDPQLAGTATAESWRDKIGRQITAAKANGTTIVENHRLTAATISLARRPGQGPPAVLVTLRGTKITTTTDSAQRPRSLSRALHVTYEVKNIDGHWLITTDSLPPGWSQP